MAIEWDVLIAEIAMLGAIIYGTIYVENCVEKRKLRREEKENAKRIIKFVTNDLKKTALHRRFCAVQRFQAVFHGHVGRYHTGGKQTLLPFEPFENLQHKCLWIKYYNNELEQWEKSDGEASVMETLNEVKGTINQSLKLLKESKL